LYDEIIAGKNFIFLDFIFIFISSADIESCVASFTGVVVVVDVC
jgi:hypothetical protein